MVCCCWAAAFLTAAIREECCEGIGTCVYVCDGLGCGWYLEIGVGAGVGVGVVGPTEGRLVPPAGDSLSIVLGEGALKPVALLLAGPGLSRLPLLVTPCND